ncbi:unnamed protein product [Malus baccata var. baccata]
MWRRLLSSSQLKTLTLAAAAPCRSAGGPARSLLHKPLPVLPSYFSTTAEAATTGVKKVEDVMPIATGHEREELEAELEEEPAVVKSYYDKRIVGCPGGEGEDEHDVVWFWLEKGKPHECPVCSQYFVLEVVGPGGSPDHSDDHH